MTEAPKEDGEVLISVEGVSKKFCRSLRTSLWYGMKDVLSEFRPLIGLPDASRSDLRKAEFWAVNNTSLSVRRGECLGLVGRNGAGKTTLLKMLNGLVKPDTGRIEIRGRVGALIALGAGFNPILTGRENIYVNGSVLGLTKKEIDSKLDEIIAFAELEEFIDTPVQSYSSGMQVRLGFSIATSVQPDVLLIDEVLAVGDVAFRTKCYDRLERLRASTAIVFVSHSRYDVMRACDRAVVMVNGGVIYSGNVTESYIRYEKSFSSGSAFVHCGQEVELVEAKVVPGTINWGDHATIQISVKAKNAMDGISIRMGMMDKSETAVLEWRSENHLPEMTLREGLNTFEFRVGPMNIQSGLYFCNFILTKRNSAQYLILAYRHFELLVRGEMTGFCHYQL